MDEALPQYRRLPGVGSGLMHQSRLYLAPDHLLMVSSSGVTETYSRFHFRDIQSISVRKSIAGKIWNVVWCALFWVFGVAVALEAGGDAMYFWLGVAGIFLILLVINIARGPTCVCQITTAVQSRKLSSLSRLRRARRVIAQLRPLIETAQGPLPPDELAQRLDQARRGLTPVAQPTPAPAPSETFLPPPG